LNFRTGPTDSSSLLIPTAGPKKRGAWQTHTRLSATDESNFRVPQGSPPYQHSMPMPDYKIIYGVFVKLAEFWVVLLESMDKERKKRRSGFEL